LRCEIPSANGDMMLSWHREDLRPLRDGITDRKGALTIDKVEPGDAGAYVCSAVPRNGVGVGVNSPLVYLVVKPTGSTFVFGLIAAAANTPIVDASSDSVNEDAPVRFRCYLPGSPDAEVEWTKEDGSPINENAIYEQGVLTIMQTKPSDSGSYVCTVKDPLTANPVYSSPIHLNVNAAPPKAPIVVSPEETVNEGAPVRLRCYLPGNLGAKLSWIREDGAPLGSDVTDEQGILTIPQAKRTDAGSYICLAQESDGAAPLRSEPARIIVNAPDTPLAPPTPTVEISSDTVVEGQAVRLTCHIPNRPEINLYWKRQDGSPLPSDAVELRGTLTIMQTKSSDSGAYVCATGHPDDYDTLSAESMPIHLTVTSTEPEQQQRQPEQYGPAATPTVDVSSDTVVEGSPVRFTCHVPNRPDLNVYWKRQDGSPLSTDS
uniref:Basement membrane proteoglycan n=1 Tax=Anisakis simplex TaxID=6269 RepID=A0A0M3KDM2_ANISI